MVHMRFALRKESCVVFICRKYTEEVFVGVSLRGNHCGDISKVYYNDGINLNSYLILTCPPRGVPCKLKGLLSEPVLPNDDQMKSPRLKLH